MSEHVTVVYDADGTQTSTITGYRISTQILPGGIGLVFVFDRRGRKVRSLHLARVWSMDKEKRRRR